MMSRFLEDYNVNAFIPSSDGPRGCIGKRYAQLEIVFTLSILVYHFHITSEIQDIEVLLETHTILTLTPKNKVPLHFTPRHISNCD